MSNHVALGHSLAACSHVELHPCSWAMWSVFMIGELLASVQCPGAPVY